MARNYSNIALDTTLNAGILAGDLSLVVASAAGWPAAPFAAVIDPGGAAEEVVQVTVKAGTTWTITRGFDGTTAAAHLAGVVVRHSAIAGDFTDLQAADAVLNGVIGSEAATRAAADTALSGAIAAHAALTTTAHGGIVPSSRILTINGTPFDLSADRSWTVGAGSVTSVDITPPAAGITASGGPITGSGAITLTLANDLAALEALPGTGLAVRSAADTWVQRALAGTSNRIDVTNGDGVAGNPTIDISSSYVGQSSITTLGTIATGAWQGTAIGLGFGGTGAALTDPNADRILFWDDSAGAVTWLTIGTNLTITGTTLDATGGSGTIDGSGAAGQVAYWSDADTIAGSANLIWDNTNAFLGIGITPTNPFHVLKGNADFRMSRGASDATPTLAIINTDSGAKASALGAGTNGSFFAFDSTGFFAVQAEAKSAFTGNTIGSGAVVMAVSPIGEFALNTTSFQAWMTVQSGTSPSASAQTLIGLWDVRTAGTPGPGFGGILRMSMASSTTNSREGADWRTYWTTATDASRKAVIEGYVYDTAERLWIAGWTNGSAPMVGFLGATPIARQTAAANASDLATAITLVNDIKAKLSAASGGFGLFT